jgi:micrococcal nuclease
MIETGVRTVMITTRAVPRTQTTAACRRNSAPTHRDFADPLERDRQAREAETLRAREAERQRAREAREQAAREAEVRRKQQEADAAARQRKATVPNSQPAPANPYPGYTGPRCYAPGGRTWKPC